MKGGEASYIYISLGRCRGLGLGHRLHRQAGAGGPGSSKLAFHMTDLFATIVYLKEGRLRRQDKLHHHANWPQAQGHALNSISKQ